MIASTEGIKRDALVSIHDVMPETLPLVQACLRACEQHSIRTVYLLVVPGLNWEAAQVQQLRQWVNDGCVLVGHGWLHQVSQIRGLKHHLHSLLISRQVAEHLALQAPDIVRLMKRCRNWFDMQSLPRPTLYVPPAWALGALKPEQLVSSGFDYVETLQGITEVHSRRCLARALLGYEADTELRTRAVRLWNAGNRMLARRSVTRLGIHPYDLQLNLATDLRSDLALYRAVTLESVFQKT